MAIEYSVISEYNKHIRIYPNMVIRRHIMKPYFNLSTGNKKLVSDSNVKFLIWNIPAVVTCPYRTKACEIACYARTAEKVYPGCLPSREKNLQESKTDDFVEKMVSTIDAYMNRKAYQIAKEVRFRIHESGDFYNKEYSEKWLEICRRTAHYKNLTFLAYTKSFVYFDGVALPENFQLLASVWSDTKKSQLDIIMRNEWRIYTAIPEKYIETSKAYGFSECTCENCNTCKTDCYHAGNNLIAVRLHGTEGKHIAVTITEDTVTELLKRHGIIK